MAQWSMALCVMKDWLLITENLGQFPDHMQRRIIDLRDRTSRLIADEAGQSAPAPQPEYLHQQPPRNIGGEIPPEEIP